MAPGGAGMVCGVGMGGSCWGGAENLVLDGCMQLATVLETSSIPIRAWMSMKTQLKKCPSHGYISGGNAGVGRAVTEHLARKNAHVIIASRSSEKAKRAIDRVGDGLAG